MTVMVILSLVLNLYWFYLMINMIFRLLGRMKQTEDEENENVELVKADGLKDKEDEEVGDKSTQGSALGDKIEEEVPELSKKDKEKLEGLGVDM